jgi:hypothetical protein
MKEPQPCYEASDGFIISTKLFWHGVWIAVVLHFISVMYGLLIVALQLIATLE